MKIKLSGTKEGPTKIDYIETQTHTPTPWKLDDTRPMVYVMGADGETIASFDRRSIEEANAAFIVRAVNAHEELLFACKEAADAIYGWDEPDNPILPLLKKAIDNVEGK